MLFQASMIIFFGGLLATSISAAPVELASRQDVGLCSPVLGGVPVKVVNTVTGNSWSAPSKTEGSHIEAQFLGQDGFVFELNGELNNVYTIKLSSLPDNGLLVRMTPKYGDLVVGTVGTVSTAGTPRFIVQCASCPEPGKTSAPGDIVASFCTITDIDSGSPVTEWVEGRLAGQVASADANQTFNLVA